MSNIHETLAEECSNDTVKYDVKVINAYKSYVNKNMILNGLTMKVKSGSIYGLLGPSGCGKSTLIQCILGTTPLDSGNIEFNVQCIKDIGYMPQDLCLDGNLSIRETIEYFGMLYNMTKKDIAKRIVELTTLLKLPNLKFLVGKLSGGQGRRVSLAISLLHDPKIILMDEPTVGIDSLLRHEIWKELKNMVEQHKKTIIITTHYIEEANKADCIGLMRNGILVEEGSPQYILDKYNTDKLESAFLKLCYNKEENRANRDGVQVNRGSTSHPNKLTTLENKFTFNRVKALMKKYMLLFSRDYILLFTMFLLPILQALVICNCVGTEIKDLKLVVKNDEIDYWDSWRPRNPDIDGCIINEQTDQKISGFVMNGLESLGYKLNEVPDHAAGDMFIKNSSKYVAFIHFPENYTEAFVRFVGDRTNYDNRSQVYINVAKQNIVFKYKIMFDMKNTLTRITTNILSSCSYNEKAAKSLNLPLDVMIAIGKDVKSYTNSIAAPFVVIGAFYFPCVFSMSIILTERLDGIFVRSMFAGVKVMELVASLFIIASVLIVIQMIIPLLIAYVLYDNPIQVTSGLLAYEIIMIFAGWTGFFYGLFIGCISPSTLIGNAAVNGISFVQAVLSGGIWPVESQLPLLRMVTELFPMRIAGNMMSNIALKGWTFDHPSVVMTMIVMLLYNVIFAFIIIGLGKLKKNMWTK